VYVFVYVCALSACSGLLPVSHGYQLTFLDVSQNRIPLSSLTAAVFNQGIVYSLNVSSNPLTALPPYFTQMWWAPDPLTTPSLWAQDAQLTADAIDLTAFLVSPAGFNAIDLSDNDMSAFSSDRCVTFSA
jgi:hypothetical protein